MYGGEKVTIWAISQDDSEDTRDFCKEFGIKFPALIDADNYSRLQSYGITNVPSMFLVAPDGKLTASSLGFDKKGPGKSFERVGARRGKAGANSLPARRDHPRLQARLKLQKLGSVGTYLLRKVAVPNAMRLPPSFRTK